jgi:hypothetical protein
MGLFVILNSTQNSSGSENPRGAYVMLACSHIEPLLGNLPQLSCQRIEMRLEKTMTRQPARNSGLSAVSVRCCLVPTCLRCASLSACKQTAYGLSLSALFLARFRIIVKKRPRAGLHHAAENRRVGIPPYPCLFAWRNCPVTGQRRFSSALCFRPQRHLVSVK